jgi:hypothetical protein
MWPDGDPRPGTGAHRRGAGRRAVAPALLTAAVLVGSVAGAHAAVTATPDDPVIVRDPAEGRPGGLELTRVQLARADDGRLRAALTLGRAWRTRDLLGPGEDDGPPGPPGSLCLRLWTRSEPTAGAPDFLVCMTADASGRDLRGSVLAEREGDLVRVAGASLTRSSVRTVVVRFAQSAVGRPATVRFAGEATAAGCAVVTCVDTAPDAPATATLTLHTS